MKELKFQLFRTVRLVCIFRIPFSDNKGMTKKDFNQISFIQVHKRICVVVTYYAAASPKGRHPLSFVSLL